MADPLSMTINVYTAFKELYLVSKFIHRTVLSAKNHIAERRELRLEFETELLFLQSLGRIYLGGNGIVCDPELDERWLRHVYNILERMRLVCSDYARIAAEDDAEYQKYSPYMNEEMANTKTIEFDISESLPLLPEPSFFTRNALRWLGIKTNKKFNSGLVSWKWALIEKKKFEDVLRRFQKLNGKLKDILPLYSAAQANSSRDINIPRTLTAPQDENTQRLGIARHVHLRELSYNPDIRNVDLLLKGRHLEATDNAVTLVPGLLSQTRSMPEKVLVEYKNYLPCTSEMVPASADIEVHRQPVLQLASLLDSAGAHDMLTLPLRGVIEQDEQHRHAFVFKFPPGVDQGTNPISLYSLIDGKAIKDRLNLSQRFYVAQQIAKTIGGFHADGWVHKSMRSESIIFFRDKTSQDLLVESPYLVNFEYSRPETAMTKYDFDDDLERNLYRHPDRQGRPKITFSKLHDMYALGVVLLEIGLWETASSIFQRVRAKMVVGTMPSPSGIRKRFIQTAEHRLAHHMGQGYVEAVLSCLDGKFDNLTSRADFPMMFHEEVVQKLDIKSISG